MRTFLASLLVLGILGASTAHANRWDQRQPLLSADRSEHRPLFQRRQAEPAQPAQPPREQTRFESPQAPSQAEPAANAANVQRAPLQPAEAGRRAQQQYGGRVLSVSPADSGYHVRLLRNGEVSSVTVPNP